MCNNLLLRTYIQTGQRTYLTEEEVRGVGVRRALVADPAEEGDHVVHGSMEDNLQRQGK